MYIDRNQSNNNPEKQRFGHADQSERCSFTSWGQKDSGVSNINKTMIEEGPNERVLYRVHCLKQHLVIKRGLNLVLKTHL